MNTALILIDIQNDYFENGANALVGSELASQNARLILEHFRQANGLIVHIKHLSTRPGSTFFIPETIGAEIHKNVSPVNTEKVIVKHFPNSFRETDLLNTLKEMNVSNLVVCGMMTHMCVDATVRAAKDLGFTIDLIGDACATKDLAMNEQLVKAADVHNSFLAALNYYYTTVKTTSEYLG